MTTNLGPDANGNNRGWAADDAAASILRIDRQLGRPADINEAGRSAADADTNYAAWIAYRDYLNGGAWAPWAPRALPASESVHVPGRAADSDDWLEPSAAAVWEDNGWRRTADDEWWHGEYFIDLDNHVNDPAPAKPAPTPKRRQTMLHAAYRTADGSIIVQPTPGAKLQGLGPTEWKGIVAANPGASAAQISDGERDGLIGRYGIDWK